MVTMQVSKTTRRMIRVSQRKYSQKVNFKLFILLAGSEIEGSRHNISVERASKRGRSALPGSVNNIQMKFCYNQIISKGREHSNNQRASSPKNNSNQMISIMHSMIQSMVQVQSPCPALGNSPNLENFKISKLNAEI